MEKKKKERWATPNPNRWRKRSPVGIQTNL